MNKTILAGPVMRGPGPTVQSNVATSISMASPSGGLRGRAPGVNMPSLGGVRRASTGIPMRSPAAPVGVIPGRSVGGGARRGRVGSSFSAPGGGPGKPTTQTPGPAGLSASSPFRPTVAVPGSSGFARAGSRLGIWSTAGFPGQGARDPIGPSAATSQHRARAGTAMPPGASKIAAPGTPVAAAPGARSGASYTAPKKKQKAKTK